MEHKLLQSVSYHKSLIVIVTVLVCVSIWTNREYLGMGRNRTYMEIDRNPPISQLNSSNVDCDKSLIQQRNQLSALLNQLKQEYGKASCDNLELQSKLGGSVQVKVSQFGGWCKSTGSASSSEHMFDQPLAEALSTFFINKRVASFGDGPGTYKNHIDATRRLQVYDAYDGAPYGPETSGGKVKFLDLTAPQYGLPSYDWILSLEVAEHIPSQFESIYIDNIVRHAGEGVVLSWAVPGQDGLAHINNRPLYYVIELFSQRGFIHDKIESAFLQRQSTLPWLQANVNVYRRSNNTPMHEIDI